MHPIEIIATIGASIILLKLVLVVLAEKEMKAFAKTALKGIPAIRWLYLALGLTCGYFLIKSIGLVALFAAGLTGALLFDFIILNYKKTMNTMLDEAFKPKDYIGYALFAALAIWVLKTIYF